MRLGIGSYTFTWAVGVPGSLPQRTMQAFDLLEKAAQLGVSVVQFADNLPLDQLDSGTLNSLEREALDTSISIEVGTRGIALPHLQKYLELAQRFSSPILRVVIDTPDYHPTIPEIISTLRQQLDRFENAKIYLAIENHDRFKATTLANIIHQLEHPYVGICLDTVNSFGSLEGPEIVLEALGAYVINLHIKDFLIQRRSHMMGFVIEGTPAGQGCLNVPWLLNTLKHHGRDPNAILELWTPPESNVDATIEKEAAWARASITYLRTLVPH